MRTGCFTSAFWTDFGVNFAGANTTSMYRYECIVATMLTLPRSYVRRMKELQKQKAAAAEDS